ncbi:DUF6773 family protein [Anaerotignum sp.]|uniref:DUF6773 family protein n=1 Tax=Anaerotignum sp. TaxID=2039241 RepID=UPI002897A3B5|nr:DUF6773 family protein [Anaerotignum sp.]
MKLQNNNLDEMQEKKLLQIEHTGCWLAFWGLLVAILVQILIFDEDVIRSVAGEWIILFCLSLYMSISSMKSGIWDRRLKPTLKYNTNISLISGLVCALIFSISSYIKYHVLMGSIATGIFMFIFIFAVTFFTLSLSVKMYHKRIRKMETDCED